LNGRLDSVTEKAGIKRGRKPAKGEPVLERAFYLLEQFTTDRPQLTVTELSAASGIPLSSTLRLARQLEAVGALERPDGNMFAVGLRLFETATLAPRAHGLRAIALPYMESLHHATKNHVMLAVRAGDEAMIIERLSSKGAGKVLFRVGERIPLTSTAVGLVLLANAQSTMQERILSRAGHASSDAGREPESAEVLRARLSGIRMEGFAVNTRMLPEPIDSVAAPIFSAGSAVVGAISVLFRAGTANLGTISAAVAAAARAISREAGSGGTTANLRDI
jgi:DNA-binding IclR family transcriptional regulator